MSFSPAQYEYPLLLLDLPRSVSALLRHAGVQTVMARSESAISADSEGRWPRFAVFDSTSPESVRLADRALRGGSVCIDIDPLLSESAAVSAGPRLRLKNENVSSVTTMETQFLRSFKRCLEVEGGIWMRLSDYPFPFHSVICGRNPSGAQQVPEFLRSCGACAWQEGETIHWQGNLADNDEPTPTEADRTAQLTDWMRSRYSNGLPIVLDTNSDLIVARKLLRGIDRQTNPFPLLWKTSLAQFDAWWELRERIQWDVHRGDKGYTVTCQGKFGDSRPELGVWKNRHLAVVPLSCGATTLNEGQLVFQSEHQRLVGGIASRCSILDRKKLRTPAARTA